MKTDAEIMTDLVHRSDMIRRMTLEESFAVKQLLVEMYRDLATICENNGLKLYLVGGSALGAVRHKGFIPWDDDLDIAMKRSDYNNLTSLLAKGALGEKYEYSCPGHGSDSNCLFLKIFRKGTVYTELANSSPEFPHGVFIDVFPIDIAPAPGIKRNIKGLISNILSFVSVSVLFAQYPSEDFKTFMAQDKTAQKRYKLRITIGQLFRLFGNHRRWAIWFDQFVQAKKETGFFTIPTGRKHYIGEILEDETFFPGTEGLFEDMKVLLPQDIDKYLSNLYGDYMTLPPEEKRECHYIMKLEL